MTEDEYRHWRESADTQENQRVDHMSAFVENDRVSGVYEVSTYWRSEERSLCERRSAALVGDRKRQRVA
jgi:hypothetical protein